MNKPPHFGQVQRWTAKDDGQLWTFMVVSRKPMAEPNGWDIAVLQKGRGLRLSWEPLPGRDMTQDFWDIEVLDE